jgi:hypothetical protein
MPEPKKRLYAADARTALKVHLVEKPSAPASQPADTPHNANLDRSSGEQRQEVVYRLIDFLKGL